MHGPCRVSWRIARALAVVVLLPPFESRSIKHGEAFGGEPTCPCEVQLQPLVRLGDRVGDGAFPNSPRSIAVSKSGAYWVSFTGQGPLKIYSSDGRWEKDLVLPTGLQTNGALDGDIGNAVIFRAPDSTMIVLDAHRGRIHRYEYDGRWRQTADINLPGEPFDQAYGTKGLIVNSLIATREQAGWPLHLFGRAGSWQTSFGADIAVMGGAELLPSQLRIVAWSLPDAVWAIQPLSYQIERWRIDGTLLSRKQRTASWFKPETVFRNPAPDSIPQTRIVAAREDRAGRLWVVGLAPNAHWKQAFSRDRRVAPLGRAREQHTQWHVADVAALYGSVIEVLGQSGELLASAHVDSPVTMVLDDDVVAGPLGDGKYYQVWRTELRSLTRR